MISEKLLRLTRRLYPKGRAFKIPFGGTLERVHTALNLSEARAVEDAKSILNSILPDNDAFTEADATQWERRLGLITSEGVSLEDRKAAITRKMNFPGKVRARQSWKWLQKQLRAAGFDVYVYENRFSDYPNGWITRDPVEVYGDETILEDICYGEHNYGEFNYGPRYNNLIANSITQAGDDGFDVGDNLRSTFFIGGNPIGTRADVPAERETEFRQLILMTKPAQTVGFLFINYV